MAVREPVGSLAPGNGYPAPPPPIVGGDYMRDQAMMKSAEEIKKMTELVAANQESLMNMGSALLESNRQRQEDRELLRRGLCTLSPPASTEPIKQESRTSWEGRGINIYTGQAQGQRTPQPPVGYREVGLGVDGKPIYQAI